MKGIILILTVTLFVATSALYITPKIGVVRDCGTGANIFANLNGTVETDPVILAGVVSTMDLKLTLVQTQQSPTTAVVDATITRTRDNLLLPCGADNFSGSCKGIPLCNFIAGFQTNPPLECPVTAARHDFSAVYSFTSAFWGNYVDPGSTENFLNLVEFKTSSTGTVFGCFEIEFTLQSRL